ncbi:hypothetical protein HK101_009739 [Irineochytrium annulatum]|nr:hypothetical protein HK101_009739 [Irineochytrium annulatum]
MPVSATPSPSHTTVSPSPTAIAVSSIGVTATPAPPLGGPIAHHFSSSYLPPFLHQLHEDHPTKTFLLLSCILLTSPLLVGFGFQWLDKIRSGTWRKGGKGRRGSNASKRGVSGSKRSKGEKAGNGQGDGILTLHAFERPDQTKMPGLPSYSPYCIKLETYLRASETPYVLNTSSRFSRKGKKPYLTYGPDNEVADSHFCILWLRDTLNICLDTPRLGHAQLGVVESYRTMIEEGILPLVGHRRWCGLDAKARDFVLKNALTPVPWFIRPFVLWHVGWKGARRAKLTGLSSHTRHEQMTVFCARLDSISTLLGDDEHVLGTDAPTSLDCVVYAALASILLSRHPATLDLEEEVMRRGNLVGFVRRMTERYYVELAGGVDWDDMERRSLELEEAELGEDVGEVDNEAEEDVEEEDEGEVDEDDDDEVVIYGDDDN